MAKGNHKDAESNSEKSLADRISEAQTRKSNLQERSAKAHMPVEGMALAGHNMIRGRGRALEGHV